MKRYIFTVKLTGYGDNSDQAWIDAVEAACLDDDPPPLEFEIFDDDNESQEY